MSDEKKPAKRSLDLEKIYLEIGINKFKIMVNKEAKEKLKNCGKVEYIKIESSEVIVKEQFFKQTVPNVYRFSVKKSEEKLTLYKFVNPTLEFEKSKYNDRSINTEDSLKSILLILESPHEDEYDYSENSFSPIAPAQGNTGDYIYDEIIDVLELIEKDGVYFNENEEYRIIIVNPVPCQTSLHYLHRQSIKSSYKTLRNKVWTTLWENKISYQIDFEKVLKELKPYVIINGCTSDLKEYVQEFISNLSQAPLFSVYHPSAWWQGYNLQKIQ